MEPHRLCWLNSTIRWVSSNGLNHRSQRYRHPVLRSSSITLGKVQFLKPIIACCIMFLFILLQFHFHFQRWPILSDLLVSMGFHHLLVHFLVIIWTQFKMAKFRFINYLLSIFRSYIISPATTTTARIIIIMINNKDSRFSDPASSQLLILVALDWLGSKQFHPSVPSGVSPGNTRWIIYSKGSVSEKRLVIYYSSAIDYYSVFASQPLPVCIKTGLALTGCWTALLSDINQSK